MSDTGYSVYVHTSPSDKAYVGITKRHPEDRWANGNGYKNPYFCQAIKKHGWDNFKHEIIQSGLSKDEAERIERELIKKFNCTDRMYGYNILPGGDVTGGGWHHTEEAKQKISEASRRMNARPEIKARISRLGISKRKPISVYDINGYHLMDCISAKEAEEKTGVPNSNVIACCRGRYNSMNNYIFRYKDDGGIVKAYKGKRIPVCQFSLQGEYLKTFPSVKDAALSVGVARGHISDSCKFKIVSSGGYLWLYEDETNRIEEKIYQYQNKQKPGPMVGSHHKGKGAQA